MTNEIKMPITMKAKLILLAALLFTPLAALQAVDKAANPEISRFQSIGPNDGAPAIAMDGPPEFIPNPSTTEVYSRAKRTCTGVPSLAITPGGRL